MPRIKNVIKQPLKLQQIQRAYRKGQGEFRETYLAVVNNVVRIPNGMFWVHDLASADASGNNTYGAAYQLPVFPGAVIDPRPNWKVNVITFKGAEYVHSMDYADMIRAGYDPHQTNAIDPSRSFKLIEHLQNLQSFPNNNATVRVMPSIYRRLDGMYDIFGEKDVDILTGNVPSTDNQVVVCLWLNDSNAIDITVSSEVSRDINLKTDTATALTLINECAELADVGSLGIWSYIIWDDTTSITAKNKFHDLRGILGAGGGTGGGGLSVATETFYTQTVLYEDTLGTNGSWDVSTISQDYDTLVIELFLRGAVSASEDVVYLSFNNDTTNANYRSGVGVGGSSSTSIVADNRRIGFAPAATSPSNYFSMLTIRIPDYTGSAEKIARGVTAGRETSTTILTQESALHWENTAAINRVAVTTDNHNTDLFATGSWIRIIGIKETDVVVSVTGTGGSDPDAIHDNVAAEISAITQKATPIATDVLLIEDSEDSFNKKYIEIGDLPGGASGDVAADTLTLNDGSELTIASGVITVTHARHIVDTEDDDPTDDLVTVNGLAANEVCIITAAHTDRTIVVKHTGGTDISCATGADITLDDTVKAVCLMGNIAGTGVNAYPLQSSAVSSALDDLTDVTITSPVAYNLLRYNGSAWVNLKNNVTTTDPTITDDSSQGYAVWSRWLNTNTDIEWICSDPTPSAAVWVESVSRLGTQTLTGKTISASANTIGYGTAVIKTLSGDVASAGSDRNLIIAAQTGTSDVLKEITGLSVGESVLVRADAGDEIQVAHNSGSATVKIFVFDGGNQLRILSETTPMRLTLIATDTLVEDIQASQRPYFDISAGLEFTVESTLFQDAFLIDHNDTFLPKVGIGATGGAIADDYLLRLMTDGGSSLVGAFGLPEVTTSERIALTVDPGAQVHDTDYGLPFAYTPKGWMPIVTGSEGIQFVDPLNLTWNALNQTSGIYDNTTDNRLKAQCAGTGTVQLRGWYATLAPPFDYRFYVGFFNSDVQLNGMAIGFRQNSTGELHTFSQVVSSGILPQYEVRKWNSATSVNSDYIAAKNVSNHVNWVRLNDNNTSARGIYISEDGTNWQQIHTIGRTDFLTADEIFFGLRLGTVSADDAQATLLSAEDIS